MTERWVGIITLPVRCCSFRPSVFFMISWRTLLTGFQKLTIKSCEPGRTHGIRPGLVIAPSEAKSLSRSQPVEPSRPAHRARVLELHPAIFICRTRTNGLPGRHAKVTGRLDVIGTMRHTGTVQDRI